MSFEPEPVSAVTFDSDSTLVDVDAIETALVDHEAVTDADTPAVANRWRQRSLEYTLVGNTLGNYQSFVEINRAALEYALAAHGIETTPEERAEILSVYHDLEPFTDVRPTLERLSEAGYDLYVLSNGSPEMLASMIEGAGIGDYVTDAISAHEVATFKPDPDLYRHAAGRTGTPIDRIAHVSALWFDVQGAVHAGMQGVWLDRTGRPWEPFGPEPDLVAEGLDGIAELLEA
ncbi:haloacid dehalogenase type II [Halobiforma nitratireducens]|uniref:Haloacid dehalogenase n=1 Tax=Halobiforma nitratireducens JCM 10879 TaxID=1227454 RepID=M0MPR4_9EURY|nr:haloacid dehalogenase type II [Halobiforma nitratireducens]EMA46450.1 haloacid dehalogenase [Halobiforma nitratireducens JCM 10879]